MSDLTPGHPDRAIAALFAPETPAGIRVAVDLSKPFSTNRLTVGFEDCDRPPMFGDLVDVRDSTAGKEATADVVAVDEERKLIRITVDWDTLREATP